MRQIFLPFVLALAAWVGVPAPASGDVIYRYHGICDSIVSDGETFLCSALPDDNMFVTVTLRDSYVPGTFLTSIDVLSVEYQDPLYLAFFDFEITSFGKLPASSWGDGFFVFRHDDDVMLEIDSSGWSYTCCGGNGAHLASGPPGVWTLIASP